ncbi:PAS domain-containing protein [Methylobacterium segetis]|uniref:PAS domain-containing protein n=1 Tax=Methylobacterium segetis TaxID=2488750 RepID=UPI0010515C1F|nr:PAS domain-containing protein [Methylobacterium segetis]
MVTNSADGSTPPSFLDGGGEAARLIRARDWSDHPLGSPECWSGELKVALSLVLNSPESMILAWGPELHFFNDTYIPLLGPRAAWATGERFDVVWAEAWDQAEPIILDAFAGRSRRFEDLPWKLGTDRGAADTWWSFSYSRVLDAQGAVAGLFIVTNETTARVLGDKARRESEEQLRLVIESAKDHAIFTTDPGGTITSWSAGAEAILGWRADEAVGRAGSIIFTPEDRADGADRRELATAAARGYANDERWHLTKAGQRVFMNGSTHPLPPDAQGRQRGFIKIARDETERFQTQRALRALTETLERRVDEALRQRKLWADVFETTDALVGALDHEFRVLAVNRAYAVEFESIYGVRPHIGDDLLALLAPWPEHQAAARRTWSRALSGEEFTLVEAFGNQDRRRTCYELRFTTLRDTEGRQIGAFQYAQDVTERLRNEEQLARTEAALRQAQKMEAVGQLTGGLAHDFNNLLAGISGSLELMQTRISQGRLTDIDRYINAAQGASRRAAALTHRLLAFSRRQTLDPKPTDVNALVGGREELIRRTVGPAVAIEVVGAAGLWPALVDPNQLENALLNLCITARDAMPEGGRITIETANKWLDERAARERDLAPGQYLSLCVTDTGTGMTPDVIARAFDPFFTTKPIGAGTGLGLSMIYGFARQSGGQVRIYSEVGEGTTMCLYLPRHYGEAEGADAVPDLAGAPRAEQGETVLIVDDEPTVRMLVTEVLEDLGYTAIEAADAVAGLRVLQSDVRIDLLVTDVGLPGGMNGRQMADAGRVSRPDLKVLFITGYAENAVVGNGHLEPGMAVLTKPFVMEALASRIKDLIARTP